MPSQWHAPLRHLWGIANYNQNKSVFSGFWRNIGFNHNVTLRPCDLFPPWINKAAHMTFCGSRIIWERSSDEDDEISEYLKKSWWRRKAVSFPRQKLPFTLIYPDNAFPKNVSFGFLSNKHRPRSSHTLSVLYLTLFKLCPETSAATRSVM